MPDFTKRLAALIAFINITADFNAGNILIIFSNRLNHFRIEMLKEWLAVVIANIGRILFKCAVQLRRHQVTDIRQLIRAVVGLDLIESLLDLIDKRLV